MRLVHKWFTDHPASVNESYFQHLAHAGWFAGQMAVGAVACLLHALIPGTCTKTGSQIITRLHDRMVVNRVAVTEPSDTGPVPAMHRDQTA